MTREATGSHNSRAASETKWAPLTRLGGAQLANPVLRVRYMQSTRVRILSGGWRGWSSLKELLPVFAFLFMSTRKLDALS